MESQGSKERSLESPSHTHTQTPPSRGGRSPPAADGQMLGTDRSLARETLQTRWEPRLAWRSPPGPASVRARDGRERERQVLVNPASGKLAP